MKKIVALSGALLFATTLARAETVVIHKDAPPPVGAPGRPTDDGRPTA